LKFAGRNFHDDLSGDFLPLSPMLLFFNIKNHLRLVPRCVRDSKGMMMIFYGVRDYFSLLEKLLRRSKRTFDTPKTVFFPSFVSLRNLLMA
jgi:hypothetical protein